MRIYVCLKHVPDTAANITLQGEADYATEALKFVPNPYDEYALEEAVRLVEKEGQGEVILVTVGPAAAVSTLRSALAMGAHRALLVKTDQKFPGSKRTARALQAAIAGDGSFDMIFTGKTAVDTEGSQTPYRLARLLDLPVANEVSSLSVNGKTVVAERERGAGTREVLEMQRPCVIGATKGLNEPRYPKFPDIMKAKKKEIKELSITDLAPGSEAESGLLKLEPVPERSGARMIKGSLQEQVDQLVETLKEEKVL
ncbi:MAG: electron transfer flavoprotein subunit beta/FixA family protein [Thermodesulfobacteriota bacterium]